MAAPTPDVDATRTRLHAHFSALSPDARSQGAGWAQLWDAGDFLPFDRGVPNPALEDTLLRLQANGPAREGGVTGRRMRALVPGCGRGYDVLLLASFGYDALGLEISAAAVAACKGHAAAHGAEYPAREVEVGKGEARFALGDFFEDDWIPDGGKFDLVYDYTFLSALPPGLRPAWALRHSQLLAPSGRLVCVEFPAAKPPSTRGPPFGLPAKVYRAHLGRPGVALPYDAEDNLLVPDEDPAQEVDEAGLACAARWRPERTHAIGRGQDMVSVWKHRAAPS
ncbi:MAG: hypothetical protein M1832_001546 [Thelocarpon impressellum]|nr:MAG: hypothetical protein M1832_001546 [Thelocarpon impressellum]